MIVKKKSSSGLRVFLWIFAIVIAVGGFAVFKFGLPMLLDKQADNELLKTPAYRQIAKWEPEAYAEMKRQMIASIQRNDPPAVAQGHVRKIVEGLAKKYMKTADDMALIDYIKVTAEEVRQVADKDSSAAFDMLFNSNANIDITKYIDQATQQHDMDALAEVIRSGVAKEASPQDDQRALQLLREVIGGMRNDFGADAELAFEPKGPKPDPAQFRGPMALEAFAAAQAKYQDRPVNKERSVQMALEFYKRVLTLRSDQSAKILRLLFSKA